MDQESASSVPPLTESTILRGGWNPRYARVLRIDQVGRVALALVDGNGDGAELEAESWCYEDDRWSEGASSGFGPLVESNRMSGMFGGLVYKAGCGAPGATVVIQWQDGPRRLIVDEHGLWVCVGEASDGALDQPPPPWLREL